MRILRTIGQSAAFWVTLVAFAWAGGITFAPYLVLGSTTLTLGATTTTVAGLTLSSPSLTSPTITSSFTATGLVTNAALANMANSTVKCRTTAGTGVPEDCTAAQTAAIVGSVGGALKSKIISGTRDLTATSGNVSYTGMGFQPTSCFAQGDVAGSISQYVTILGMADSARTSSVIDVDASVVSYSGNFMVFGNTAGTGYNNATIASYDADGLTLTWTKTGSPSGTASFTILCYR